MKLKNIFVITGKSGLFKLVSESPKMIVVESIIDGTKTPIYAHDKASSLGEICILTTGEDITLKNVFRKIREKSNGVETISHKSDANVMKSYFEELVPDYDRNRVYASDMKKVFNWYNLLHSSGLLDLIDEADELDEVIGGEESAKTEENKNEEPVVVEKPKKTTAKKTTTAASKKTITTTEVKSGKAPKARAVTKKG